MQERVAELALAIDIGGTKVESALVTSSGAILEGSRHRAPTGRERSADELDASVRDVVASALAAAPADSRVVGAGIGSAGPISLPEGAISPLNIPQWREHRIGDFVAEASGLPTAVRLDGQCFALAEAWVGSLAGARNGIAMVVSTGVGSGVILDGALVRGHSGNAGHIGQMIIRDVAPGGDPDAASVERISSGTGTVAWARSQGWAGRTGEQLVADALAGEELPLRAIRRSAAGIAQAVASAGALIDIEAVSIAGGFALGYPGYIDEVTAALERFSVLPHTARIAVHRSALGGDAPLIGAGGLVLRG